MRKVLFFIISISACWWLLSCKKEVDCAMDRAELLMEEAPDSALKIMEQIKPVDLSSSRNARYALLLTQARYKNYIDETDDSLINIAVRYYKHSDDIGKRVQSHFLKARILEQAGNYSHSIVSALDAEQAAIILNDPLWLGRVYELIADLYKSSYNIPESIKYRKLAVGNYSKSNNRSTRDWALIDLANSYHEMHDSIYNVKCIFLLDSIYNLCCDSTRSDYFWGYLYSSYIGPFYELGKDSDAIFKFKELEYLYPNYQITAKSYAYISRAFINMDLDSAKYYYEKSRSLHSSNRLSEYVTLYNIFIKQNDIPNALITNLKISAIQDSIVAAQSRQSLSIEQRDYLARMAAKEKIISKRRKLVLIIGTIISMIILLLVYLYYKERILRKNAELSEWIYKFKNLSKDLYESKSVNEELTRSLNEILNEISIVNSELSIHRAMENELNKTIRELFGSHFEALNLICSEYLEKKDESDKIKLTIFKSIKKEIDRMSDAKTFDKLENIVNACNGDILKRFKIQFPEMSKINMQFITLSFARLSPQAISLILKIGVSNCYTKKHRLRTQIKNSEAKDREEFLHYLK